MVRAIYLIVASIEIDQIVIRRIIFEKDTVTIRWRLRLFVFVIIVVKVALVRRLEVDLGLEVTRILLHMILKDSLTIRKIVCHLTAFSRFA